jgi:hypothetical protein
MPFCEVARCSNWFSLHTAIKWNTKLCKRHRRKDVGPTGYYYFYTTKTRFGLTEEDYKQLWDKQDGRCAICQSAFSMANYSLKPCIDHDHKTNKVRGLVCQRCNKAIGYLKDEPLLLLAAQIYLEESLA